MGCISLWLDPKQYCLAVFQKDEEDSSAEDSSHNLLAAFSDLLWIMKSTNLWSQLLSRFRPILPSSWEASQAENYASLFHQGSLGNCQQTQSRNVPNCLHNTSVLPETIIFLYYTGKYHILLTWNVAILFQVQNATIKKKQTNSGKQCFHSPVNLKWIQQQQKSRRKLRPSLTAFWANPYTTYKSPVI